jgi:hypothetical protein
MNRVAPTSPEILAQKIRNAGFLSRAVAYFLRPFTWRLKAFYLKVKYAHHADKRTLNWDWTTINYNRIALVNLLIGKFSAPAYLEIGCASDGLFNSLPTLNKTGVDPSSGGTVRMTSDDFFASNATRFDVVFIDGLHTYEQVRRDTINALACLNPGGWIALHDMLPRNWIEQHVPPVSGDTWTGDVWKLAFELKETHGIEFKVLKIDHGVGVIKVIEPSVLLSDLRHELSDKTFSYYFDHLRQLPIIEWNDAQVWLRS